jgi:hypothetical protein
MTLATRSPARLDAESNYGSELLNLEVAKGYLTKLLANAAVKATSKEKSQRF